MLFTNLTYPPFEAIKEVRNAARNSPPLKRGNKNSGVIMLQAALIELGYKMPRSTKSTNQTDGVYGFETFNVVTKFQEDNNLQPQNGIAGKSTIVLLDKLLAKKNKTFVPVKPAKPLVHIRHESQSYKLGSASPRIKSDVGAGVFNSKPTEATMWALKQAILGILPPSSMVAELVVGRDAAKNMLHYLSALGTPKKIDLEKMLRESAPMRKHFKKEIDQAKAFIELNQLPVGTHLITSKNVEGVYNYKEESKNWFYAIGGCLCWGEGKVVVQQSGRGEVWYELDFEFHMFDRYNWDEGKEVEIAGITVTDEFMGKFHRQGLAQEYNCYGVVKRHINWIQGRFLENHVYEPVAKVGR